MTEQHLKGARARAAALSPERRREIAVEAARARWEEKSVYVIGYEIDSTAVKIGVAKNPDSRLRALQTSSHLKMVCHHIETTDRAAPAHLVERVCHHILRGHRLTGEWFGVSVEIAVATIHRAKEIVGNGEAAAHLPSLKTAPLKLPHRKWKTDENGRRVIDGIQTPPITLRIRKGSALMGLWLSTGRSSSALSAMLHGWADEYGAPPE